MQKSICNKLPKRAHMLTLKNISILQVTDDKGKKYFINPSWKIASVVFVRFAAPWTKF